jgi:hypothetical protein
MASPIQRKENTSALDVKARAKVRMKRVQSLAPIHLVLDLQVPAGHASFNGSFGSTLIVVRKHRAKLAHFPAVQTEG